MRFSHARKFIIFLTVGLLAFTPILSVYAQEAALPPVDPLIDDPALGIDELHDPALIPPLAFDDPALAEPLLPDDGLFPPEPFPFDLAPDATILDPYQYVDDPALFIDPLVPPLPPADPPPGLADDYIPPDFYPDDPLVVPPSVGDDYLPPDDYPLVPPDIGDDYIPVVPPSPPDLPEIEVPQYAELMRSLRDFGNDEQTQDGEYIDPYILEEQLNLFIDKEREELSELGIPSHKVDRYVEFLEEQRNEIFHIDEPWYQEIGDYIGEITDPLFDYFRDDVEFSPMEEAEGIRIPEHPSTFSFSNDKIIVESLQDPTVEANSVAELATSLRDLVSIRPVVAEQMLPVLKDVRADGEVIINTQIKELARSLEHNPVKIFNYVRNNIDFEPYYGAKKGSVGCLQEALCNDKDTSSLLIALLRASGIPARYRKTVAIVPVEDLKNLLGVDETKTVFAAFYANKVPIHTLKSENNGKDLTTADFSKETDFALEWVHVQAYYDYDERGGNITNYLTFDSAKTDKDVQAALANEVKKQWISIDPVIKSYKRDKKTILPDTTNINVETFWYDYLKYNGDLTPNEKYLADLKTKTGKDPKQFLSTKSLIKKEYGILPITLPYKIGEGVLGDGTMIKKEIFSAMPDKFRDTVEISLLKEKDNSVVLSKKFYGNEINNVELDLLYKGATAADKKIIEKYGGLARTPAALVDITPYFLSSSGSYEGSTKVKIGDALILRFTYSLKGKEFTKNEKFSTAGNAEGIYVSLSKTQTDPSLNSDSRILLRGNVGLAREYLKRMDESQALLGGVFGYDTDLFFSRAVVTQNRILGVKNNIPTTFDFKGLSIDAQAYINDYSNRGDHESHRKDFRLLWGLQASNEESNLFTDVTGLDAISSVEGLQYAYKNPNTYKVYKITKTNKSDIDKLSLSANTIANMKKDVDNGNTIITPDKFVKNGVWKGLFYISLKPDWTGTYAIGEQSQQNGAWTVEEFLDSKYKDEDGLDRNGYINKFDNETYYYEDNADTVAGIQCRLENKEKNTIKALDGWKDAYGYPCKYDSLSFTGIQHSFALASNGAYFYRPSVYSYWASQSAVTSKMQGYIDNMPSVEDTYTFQFSEIAGTYIWSICKKKGKRNCDNNEYATIYYSPGAGGHSSGKVVQLMGGFLDKAENDGLIPKIGFPITDEIPVENKTFKTKGVYQSYVNGKQFYYVKRGHNTYYSYGKLTKVHDDKDGVIGSLGFPVDDPNIRNGRAYQEYQGDMEIGWNLGNGSTKVEGFKNYRCELYGNVKDPFRLGLYLAIGIYDTAIQTIADIIDLIILVEKLRNPTAEDVKKVKEFVDEVLKLDIKNDIIPFLKSVSGTAYKNLIDEYDTSLGANGCSARTNYIGGRLAGHVILIYFSASKLSALSKVKILNRAAIAFSKLDEVAKIGKFGKKFRFVNADDAKKWKEIMKITDSNEKGKKARDLLADVVPHTNIERKIEDRIVDIYDAKTGYAHEVKMWKNKVSHDGLVKDQIQKDIDLMNKRGPDEYRPIWHFLEGEPTEPLKKIMEENGIEYILYIN